MVNFAIIGLGNPGEAHQKTRHNLGFWLLDKVAEKENVYFKKSKEFHADHLVMTRNGKKILLVKPKTFMNESGCYLANILNYFRCSPTNMILAHDELTLPFGEIKISKNRGAGGHNGVTSVMSTLGNTFIRFRLGIGSKTHPQMNLADFVLSKLSSEELTILEDRRDNICDALFSILDNGLDTAMNLINQTNRSQSTS